MFLFPIFATDITLPQIIKRIGNVGNNGVKNAIYPESLWDTSASSDSTTGTVSILLRRFQDNNKDDTQEATLEATFDHLYHIPYEPPSGQTYNISTMTAPFTLSEFLFPAVLPFSQINNQVADLQKAGIVAHDISGMVTYPDNQATSHIWKALDLYSTTLSYMTDVANTAEYSFLLGQIGDSNKLLISIKWLSKLIGDDDYLHNFIFTKYKEALKRNLEEPFNRIDYSIFWMVFIGAIEYLGQVAGSLPVSEYNAILEQFTPLWLDNSDIETLVSYPSDKVKKKLLLKIHEKIYDDNLFNIKSLEKIFFSMENNERKELLDYLCSAYIYISFRESPTIEYDEENDTFIFYRSFIQ